MKIITKKKLGISFGLLAIITLVVWYFYPLLLNRWVTQKNADAQKYLRMMPTYMEELPAPPKEWTVISIGEVALKLPISKYNEISGGKTNIRFLGNDGSVLINDIAPPKELLKVLSENKLKYPHLSFQERKAILKSLPSDISFFNSRSNNVQSSLNQTLKFISIPQGGFDEVRIVDSGLLKAICIISEKREKGYHAFVDVYSQNESSFFSIFLMRYKDKKTIDADLRNILGSIKITNNPTDIETATRDIQAIVRKYHKT